jgi:hypothetical protein
MGKKEKIVGTVKSKSSEILYDVKWNFVELSLWIKKDGNTWQLIGENIENEEFALKFAQSFINSHPKTF